MVVALIKDSPASLYGWWPIRNFSWNIFSLFLDKFLQKKKKWRKKIAQFFAIVIHCSHTHELWLPNSLCNFLSLFPKFCDMIYCRYKSARQSSFKSLWLWSHFFKCMHLIGHILNNMQTFCHYFIRYLVEPILENFVKSYWK